MGSRLSSMWIRATWNPAGSFLSLEECIEIAGSRDIPVVVDTAGWIGCPSVRQGRGGPGADQRPQADGCADVGVDLREPGLGARVLPEQLRYRARDEGRQGRHCRLHARDGSLVWRRRRPSARSVHGDGQHPLAILVGAAGRCSMRSNCVDSSRRRHVGTRGGQPAARRRPACGG